METLVFAFIAPYVAHQQHEQEVAEPEMFPPFGGRQALAGYFIAPEKVR
jgi:hypothetical protein